MKTIYEFTDEEKAELDRIDREIAALCQRKVDIYITARVKYVTETPEEVKAVEREIFNRSLAMHSCINGDYGFAKRIVLDDIVRERGREELG